MEKLKRKKSYNPFKMWGAWLGLIVGALIGHIQFYYPWNTGYLLLIDFSEFFGLSILGFLIGWGVHSLFRGFRQKWKN